MKTFLVSKTGKFLWLAFCTLLGITRYEFLGKKNSTPIPLQHTYDKEIACINVLKFSATCKKELSNVYMVSKLSSPKYKKKVAIHHRPINVSGYCRHFHEKCTITSSNEQVIS